LIVEANRDDPAIETENLPEFGQLDRVPPSTSLPAPSRPKSGAVTGGGIGSAIAVFAQTLRDPYKTWAVMLAPSIAVVITATWPRVQLWASEQMQSLFVYANRVKIRWVLDRYIKKQKKKLENGKLTKEQRTQITANIKKVEDAMIDHDFASVQDYIP
jgi:hypothetical protein